MPPPFARPQQPQETHRAPTLPEVPASTAAATAVRQGTDEVLRHDTEREGHMYASLHNAPPPTRSFFPETRTRSPPSLSSSVVETERLESAYAHLVRSHPYFTEALPQTSSHRPEGHGEKGGSLPYQRQLPLAQRTAGASRGNTVVRSWWGQQRQQAHRAKGQQESGSSPPPPPLQFPPPPPPSQSSVGRNGADVGAASSSPSPQRQGHASLPEQRERFPSHMAVGASQDTQPYLPVRAPQSVPCERETSRMKPSPPAHDEVRAPSVHRDREPQRTASRGHVDSTKAARETLVPRGTETPQPAPQHTQPAKPVQSPPPETKNQKVRAQHSISASSSSTRPKQRPLSDYEAALSAYERSMLTEARLSRLAAAAKRETVLERRRDVFHAYTRRSDDMRRTPSGQPAQSTPPPIAAAEKISTQRRQDPGHKEQDEAYEEEDCQSAASSVASTSIVTCEVTADPMSPPPPPPPSTFIPPAPRRTLEEEIARASARQQTSTRGVTRAACSSAPKSKTRASPQPKGTALDRFTQTQATPASRGRERPSQHSSGPSHHAAKRAVSAAAASRRPSREHKQPAYLSAFPALVEGRELLKDIENHFSLFRRYMTPPRPLSCTDSGGRCREEGTQRRGLGTASNSGSEVDCSGGQPGTSSCCGERMDRPHVSVGLVHSFEQTDSGEGSPLPTKSLPAAELVTTAALTPPRRLYEKTVAPPEGAMTSTAPTDALRAFTKGHRFVMTDEEFRDFCDYRARHKRYLADPTGLHQAYSPSVGQPRRRTAGALSIPSSVGEAERQLRLALWRTRLLDPSTGTDFALMEYREPGGGEGQLPGKPTAAQSPATHSSRREPWPFQTNLHRIFPNTACIQEAAAPTHGEAHVYSIHPASASAAHKRLSRAVSPALSNSSSTTTSGSEVEAAFALYCDAVRAAAAMPPRPPPTLRCGGSPASDRSCRRWDGEDVTQDLEMGFTPSPAQRPPPRLCNTHATPLTEAELTALSDASSRLSFQPELAAVWGVPSGGSGTVSRAEPYYGPGDPSSA